MLSGSRLLLRTGLLSLRGSLLLSGPRLLLRTRLLRRRSCLLLRTRLLRCGPRLLRLLGVLRLLRFSLFLLVLSIRGDKRPEKQKQGSGTGNSNEMHSNRLHKGQCRVCTQTASLPDLMFQRLCSLRFSLGLMHSPSRMVGRRVDRIQL